MLKNETNPFIPLFKLSPLISLGSIYQKKKKKKKA